MRKLIDFYELTMSYSDFLDNKHETKACFDVFFRNNLDNGGYSIFCGLDEIIKYIKEFKFSDEEIKYLNDKKYFNNEFVDYLSKLRFTGDIYSIPDGTPIFPQEPCITVYANLIEAKIIETDLLNKFNHGSMIATKARRIVNEAKGRPIMEFGARRAHGGDAAAIGSRYAYIGGFCGTSCFATGMDSDIPLLGTMAHSHIMSYDNEYDAFLAYARAFPQNSVFLVDTYDTIKSGVPNAIKVAKEYLIPKGYKLSGIRLDSGDLAYLSKKARQMLDEAGLTDTKICVSNALDEVLIRDLLIQDAPIDSFGVGENLITSKTTPVFGGVYKMAGIEEDGELVPKLKISENVAKLTNPGYKKVYRFFDKETGFALGDVIALADETIATDEYTLIDENEEWKRKTIKDYLVRELQIPIFRSGELVYNQPSIEDKKEYCTKEINTLYPEILRINNPHKYYVDLSDNLRKMKKGLINNFRNIKIR